MIDEAVNVNIAGELLGCFDERVERSILSSSYVIYEVKNPLPLSRWQRCISISCFVGERLGQTYYNIPISQWTRNGI